jgi:hypothetical protein
LSLILDALNRSRQDTDEVPSLATQHYVDDVASEGKGRQYLPWLALLVALVIIGWLLLNRETGPVPAPLPQAAMPVSPAQLESGNAGDNGAVPAPAPEQVPPAQISAAPAPRVKASDPRVIESAPVTATQAMANDPAVAQLYQQRQTPQSAVENASRPGQALQAPAVTQAKEPSVEAEQEPAPATSQNEQPIDIEKMILKARDELENANLDEHSVPLLSRLSQQTKDSVPTIFYERHDYSDNKAQSSVVLNGKSTKVGGSPTAGLKVEEILPDSVVLNYRGTQFRLRALNSWINL